MDVVRVMNISMLFKNEAHLMRKAVFVLIVALLFIPSAAALDFEEMSFSDGGVIVYARASAEVPWSAPFIENVTFSISVWPSSDGVAWTRISSVLVAVHSAEPDGSSFSLIASDVYDFSTFPEGGDHVNTTVTVTLAGSGIGSQSYFAVSVVGQYGNDTDTISYTASSSENFLGPFSISYSPTSPQFLFGMVVTIVFIMVIVLVMWGTSRISKRPGREALLKE